MRQKPLFRPLHAACLLLAMALSAPAGAADAEGTVLAADVAETTSAGTTFTAPAGWTLRRDRDVIQLVPPEGGSTVDVVDVQAADGASAIRKAWERSGTPLAWKPKLFVDRPGRDGWDKIAIQEYDVPATAHRVVLGYALGRGDRWTVLAVDFAAGDFEKRGAQLALVYDRMLPQGYSRESFAGREAHALDGARLEQLRAFVREAQRELGVPGVGIGIVQDGKVVMAEGFGVRELGRPEPVDAQSLFMVASNTKAMTTLLLGRLVDAGQLRWDQPVTELMPDFRLGDADTTARVRVEHLVCACTGLPRQDFEWLMEFDGATAATTLQTLATMQPTSDFGALFQYSNPLASAGGYVAAFRLFPEMELGAAYDRAMQEHVFGPLGMTATTFDFATALAGNHAAPHAWDIDGKPAVADMAPNYAVIPVRPAGGAWSNVEDMLRYVRMELDRGLAADGTRVVSEAVIDERLRRKVAGGNDWVYGMGLETDTTWGVPVVHHGGSMFGFKSDMMWLPGHGIGAVILTNADEGGAMLGPFRRRLLELAFDGKAEAAEDIATTAANRRKYVATERATLTLPADPAAVAKLAPAYRNDALGAIATRTGDGGLVFDLGEWTMRMASRVNADGSLSFYAVDPGKTGFEFVMDAKGQLVMRTPQKEYVFAPAAAD